jgi:hypothetical protein
MLIPNYIEKMMELTHTFGWLVGVDDKLNSHLCRTCGARRYDDEHLIILITPSLEEHLVETIQDHPRIVFTIVDAHTLESYQFKGTFVEKRTLSAEEELMKQRFMDGIEAVLLAMGFDYHGRFNQYADLKGLAVKMKVEEIYEQTPKPGTGKMLIVK